MQTFTIAPAEPGDLADVAALFRAYAAALDIDLGVQGFEQELAELPGAYAPPHGALLLARGEKATSLGCVAIRRLDGRACEMKRLYVCPEARGTGLGRALVAAVLAEAPLSVIAKSSSIPCRSDRALSQFRLSAHSALPRSPL